MAINTGIQNLINADRKLSTTDVNNLFYYFYGRSASSAEKSYWSKKTSKQLGGALEPNAKQFKKSKYYKDVVKVKEQETKKKEEQEAEKKRQQEAEKKRQQEAEKKRQQEAEKKKQQEAEKKKQQEAERKRQQEAERKRQQEKNQQEQQVRDMFSKYGYTPTQADINYWKDPNKKNDIGNLETNLSTRKEKEAQQTTTPDTISPSTTTDSQHQGVQMPTNFKTAYDDVIANFSRYKGREPHTKEDWENVAYLMGLSPQEVESRLKGNTTKPEQTTPDKTSGTQLVNEQALQDARNELASLGIPESEWFKYISSPDANGKITYTPPSDTTSPTGTPPSDTNAGQIGEEVKLPEHLQEKLYEATGRIKPTQEDLDNFQYNPSIFERQLDDLITQKQTDTQSEADKIKADEDKTIADKKIEEDKLISEADPSGKEAFMPHGDKALIRFSEDPDGSGPQSTSTIWIVNKADNTFRPILSEEAFNNNFEISLQEAMSTGAINTISINDTGANGMFPNFKILSNDYGLGNDRVLKPYDAGIDSDKLKESYGKKTDPDTVIEGIKELKGTLNWLKGQEDSGLSAETIDKILTNGNSLAFYVNAMKYGGYLVNDVYRDLKRKQLIDEGRDDLAGVTVISPDVSADKYHLTNDYKQSRNNPDLAPPAYIGDVETGLLENPIFKIPSDAYDILVPPIDFTTPEGQAELDKIKSSYHDLLMKQAEATTEQAKEVANHEYTQFKEEMEKKFNITLSDNSNEAWGQISQLGTSMTKRGLAGSGIEKEARDRYLKDIRKGDQRLRDSKATTETEAKRKHLMQYGNAEDIAGLSDEEKKMFGFVPEEDTVAWFSKENLKKEYPKLTDEQIDKYRESMFDITTDENGNEQLLYKSALYQQLFKNKYGADYGLVVPEMGISPAKKAFQEAEAIKAKLEEEQKAYEEYTKADPFDYTGDMEEGTAQPITLENGQVISPNDPNYETYKEQERIKRGETTGTETTNQGQFYRIGQDIYEAGTNRKIGPTEWNRDWSGKAVEVDAPSTGNETTNQGQQTTNQGQFYRIGQDIYEAGTNRKIGPTEWNRDWSGKAVEVDAPSTGNETTNQGQTTNQLTMQNLLADPRITQDKGVNGTTMGQWLQGNASLIPGLAQKGYTVDDLINEAYSRTRYDKSAFSGDMMQLTREQNTPFGQAGQEMDKAKKLIGDREKMRATFSQQQGLQEDGTYLIPSHKDSIGDMTIPERRVDKETYDRWQEQWRKQVDKYKQDWKQQGGELEQGGEYRQRMTDLNKKYGMGNLYQLYKDGKLTPEEQTFMQDYEKNYKDSGIRVGRPGDGIRPLPIRPGQLEPNQKIDPNIQEVYNEWTRKKNEIFRQSVAKAFPDMDPEHLGFYKKRNSLGHFVRIPGWNEWKNNLSAEYKKNNPPPQKPIQRATDDWGFRPRPKPEEKPRPFPIKPGEKPRPFPIKPGGEYKPFPIKPGGPTSFGPRGNYDEMNKQLAAKGLGKIVMKEGIDHTRGQTFMYYVDADGKWYNLSGKSAGWMGVGENKQEIPQIPGITIPDENGWQINMPGDKENQSIYKPFPLRPGEKQKPGQQSDDNIKRYYPEQPEPEHVYYPQQPIRAKPLPIRPGGERKPIYKPLPIRPGGERKPIYKPFPISPLRPGEKQKPFPIRPEEKLGSFLLRPGEKQKPFPIRPQQPQQPLGAMGNAMYQDKDGHWQHWQVGKPSSGQYNLPTKPQQPRQPLQPGIKQKPFSNLSKVTNNDRMKTFTNWTKGKTDKTNSNWQGYSPISGSEYKTPAQRKKWGNVQNISGTLFGKKI